MMLRLLRINLFSLSRQASSSSSNSQVQDHYLTLGVNRNASAKEIKTAFYELSKKYHPDRHPTNKNIDAVKFQNIVNAYEILGNMDKRKVYDSKLLPPHYQVSGFTQQAYDYSKEETTNVNDRFRARADRTSLTRDLYYANSAKNRVQRWDASAKDTTREIPFEETDFGVDWKVFKDIGQYVFCFFIVAGILRAMAGTGMDYSTKEVVVEQSST